ncbi:MAG: hypothetical protein H0T66_00005 [Geodermatophilaceae bacterium]|nr:hypothetical protein [Geodermatophilaceae bacterium]
MNENSGFDCVSGQCACDATGQWVTACTDGGAVWNADTCFCYWGTSALPSTSPDPEPDDEVYCWWDWWGRDCEPDEWVDTSYYEKVCYSDGTCYWDYVDDGYYTDGDCEEQWVSRCSDGSVWRYF